jgi:hydroxymethylglutaryl-CoA lyase
VKIHITEVGPRDGLQNEKENFSLAQKKSLILKLIDAGAKHIEPGSFVSPVWVPQMQGSGKLYKKITEQPASKNVRLTCLVPNLRGLQDALKYGVKDIAVFAACSESFSRKNINCSIEESFQRFEQVVSEARKNKVKVRGYLSTVFGCPYEGKVSEAVVIKNAKRMRDLGVYEISFGDTIGVANPKQVARLGKKILKEIPKAKVAMHFHDTRGMALANICASIDLGITKFDASVGGLGGCPYAAGASGNVATEDVVNMLHEMGHKTDLDLKKLQKIAKGLEKSLGRSLPSKLAKIKL